MFEPKKKKPGMAVVIAMKGKPDPEEPDSLEKPPSEKPMAKTPTPLRAEQAETPEHEGEYKLTQDIEAVGEKHGLDPDQSRAIAADLFGAMAECLRRDESTDESDEDYPA